MNIESIIWFASWPLLVYISFKLSLYMIKKVEAKEGEAFEV